MNNILKRCSARAWISLIVLVTLVPFTITLMVLLNCSIAKAANYSSCITSSLHTN